MREDFIFKDAPPHLYFWTKRGIAVRSLPELLTILEQMDDETFRHHVTHEKNDFSEWIKNVFHEKSLAEEVSNLSSKEGMIEAIRRRLSRIKEPALEKIEENIEDTEEQIKQILEKEREIAKREEKIREIEERIEKKLDSAKIQKDSKTQKDAKFFSKEFIQGIVVGLLLSAIGVLVYVKFFG